MKNGLLIWNVILSLVAGYLLIDQFTGKKNREKTGTGAIRKDSAALNKSFRIAYFEMDSVAANFELVKEVKTELTRKEDEINSEMTRLSRNLQQKFNYYQNQAQSGSLTQAQSEQASNEMKNLDEQMKSRKQQLDQEYFDLKTRRENDVKTKIEDFLKEYNKNHNYSYIVSYEQGLFFYRDTAYNITADVVKGLNSLHPPKKK
jgi:outer membrane protein